MHRGRIFCILLTSPQNLELGLKHAQKIVVKFKKKKNRKMRSPLNEKSHATFKVIVLYGATEKVPPTHILVVLLP